MLKKKNRVSRRTIEGIFKNSSFVNSVNLTFRFVLNKNSKNPAISFIVPKNIAKSAVKRNFLRRRGYAILRKHLINFPPSLVGIFIFKKYQDNVLILENEIKNILHKIH